MRASRGQNRTDVDDEMAKVNKPQVNIDMEVSNHISGAPNRIYLHSNENKNLYDGGSSSQERSQPLKDSQKVD